MASEKKLNKLRNLLSKYGSCLIAFSGGVDSTFLLKVASTLLTKEKLLAVTAISETYPGQELEFSRKIAKRLKVRHKIIKTSELKEKRFVENPINRCYFCKKELFGRLKDIAKDLKLNCVLDASNASDKSDFRPGSIAKKELKVRSPLQEAGLKKEEIRKLSKKMGLATWDKPSLACLASRIPYGTRISPLLLKRINQAEQLIRGLGFNQVRVRHYNGLCRIEVPKKDIPNLINLHNLVVDKMKDLGYNYVTVDLEGYRTGSLNEVIKK